jgi:hypothetical protein
MKENILAFIILFVLGCGAQNNPKQREILEDGTMDNNALTTDTSSILPNIIDIPFPMMITELSLNSLFNQNIKRIQKIINLSKKQLIRLEQIMPQIIKECDTLQHCSFPKNHFSIKENNQHLSFGQIEFIRTKENHYQLQLKVNSTSNLSFRWSDKKNDTITIYKKKHNKTTLHYMSDLEQKESMTIHDKQAEEYNNYLVQTDLTNYTLSSNHIFNTHSNFSSYIKIKQDTLQEYNENIFKLSINTNRLKEGSYLLLPPNTDVKKLTIINILELTQGIVSFFNTEVQGFLYSDTFIDRTDELILYDLAEF